MEVNAAEAEGSTCDNSQLAAESRSGTALCCEVHGGSQQESKGEYLVSPQRQGASSMKLSSALPRGSLPSPARAAREATR